MKPQLLYFPLPPENDHHHARSYGCLQALHISKPRSFLLLARCQDSKLPASSSQVSVQRPASNLYPVATRRMRYPASLTLRVSGITRADHSTRPLRLWYTNLAIVRMRKAKAAKPGRTEMGRTLVPAMGPRWLHGLGNILRRAVKGKEVVERTWTVSSMKGDGPGG